MEERIELGGFEVLISRKKVKNISLRVLPPDGKVKVTIPPGVKDEKVLDFIRSKENWIRKHQTKIIRNKFNNTPEYKDDEEHFLFGVPYTLKLNESVSREGVIVKNRQLLLYTRSSSDMIRIENILNDWYKYNLENNLKTLFSKWEKKMGLKVKEYRVRKMKTRWGTCNPAKGRIWISLMLAKRRPALVEYIVVHEMAHLIERGHNRRFYSVMDKYLPGWKELRKELR